MLTTYIIKRLLLALFTLLTIMFASYTLLRLAPGEQTRSDTLFGNSGNMDSKFNTMKNHNPLKEELNLDKPVYIGFYLWLKEIILHGDLGESAVVEPGKKVTELIGERIGLTVKLNFLAISLIYILSVPIGVFSAEKAGSAADRITEIILFILYSLPVMWVGLLLQSLLCEGGKFPIFPIAGTTVENSLELSAGQYFLEEFKHLFLPVICLSYTGLAGLSRYTRSSVLQNIRSDYMRTALAKGLPGNTALWKHAFGNAFITMITLFSGLLPALITGSVLIETIYNLPGMGTLAKDALYYRDYPLQMAIFAFAGALTLTGIFIGDLLYMVADPRIRLNK